MKTDALEIRWPSGKLDRLTNLPINTYIKVVEGEGVVKVKAVSKRALRCFRLYLIEQQLLKAFSFQVRE